MRFQPTSFRESLRSASGKRRPKPRGRRLYLEALETRIVLSNFAPPYNPSEVKDAYGINQIAFGSTPGDGAGQTIAIIDPGDDSAFVNSTATNFDTSDLHIFDQQYGLPDPPSFTVIGESGGARPTYTGIATIVETGTPTPKGSITINVTLSSPPSPALSVGDNITIAEAGVSGYDGSGYKVTSVTNPTTFSATGIPANAPTSPLPSSTGGTLNNPVDTGETALDVEWSHSIAPMAKIVLIEMAGGFSNLDVDVVNAVQTASSPAVHASVVSMSFAFNEFSGETNPSPTDFDDGLFSAPDVSYVASSGDNGSPPQYPAASPNVLAVAATNLLLSPTDGSYQGETGWSNPNPPPPPGTINPGGSGGGRSQFETQPAYQQGTVTSVPPSMSLGTRTNPDVSIIGSNLTGVEIYDTFGGGFYGVAGTSLSAPCWAGLIAITDQGLALRGQPSLQTYYPASPVPPNSLQTDLYDLPLSDFHDITSGNNGFAAGVGYDLVTGIGSPVANLLIPDLAGTSIDYTVPSAGSPHQLVLRKDGTNVELLDNGVVVASQPLDTVSDVNITDPNTSNDSLTVDYVFDGIFAAQVDFDHTVSSGYDTVAVNAPNGPSNIISVNENPDVVGAGSIILDGASQTINFQTVSEVDVNAGSGGDTITLNGQGGNSGLSKVNIKGGVGNDTLIVNSSNGLFATPTSNTNGIFFNGGGGFDGLMLLQTGGTTQTSDVYHPGPNTGEGIDVINGPSGTQTVSFQNLAPVYDNVPGPLTVVGTASNDTINYEQGPNSGNAAAPYNGDTTGLATVNNFEALEFSHKTTLTLQGGNGDDTFVINDLSTPTGLATINVSGQLGNNTLVVDANSMSVTSSMVTSSQVDIPVATPVPIGYDTTIEQVTVIHALDALSSTGAFIPNGVEGVPLNNVLVGTFQFTDLVPPPVFGNPADFTATINWGDGSAPSAGTIVQTSPDAANQVTFQVLGTHTYAEENAPGTLYQISVTIHDKGSTRTFTPTGGVPTQIVDNPGASTTTPGPGAVGAAQAMVIDAPITAQAAPISAVEGQPLPVTTILATFMDTDPLGTTTDYTATVNWGDGTPTVSAMIAEPAGPGLPFDVSQAAILGHTYAAEGNYVTTIVIADAGGSKTIVSGAVIVADAPLTSAGLPTPPIIQEGTQFSGAVATFSDLDPAGTPSDYTATITWGDGVTTLGSIVPGTPGLFNVLGTHTFEEVGTYTVSVVIADAGGATTTAVSTFIITDAPLLVAPIPPITETQAQSFTAPVGAFTDADALSTTSDFSATINWGDGSPVTSGVISQQAGGTYIVTGTHTYAANTTGLPPFPVTFSVKDIGGSTLVDAVGSPVTVLDASLSSSAGATIKGIEGITTGTVVIGTFTDANPLATASDFTAILPPGGWGDGTPLAPTALTVTQISATTSSTVFEVTGSHIYADVGQFPITVNVSDAGGASTVIFSTALIADAPLAFPPQLPIRTTEAAIYPLPVLAPPLFSGAVAYFTDANPGATASDFTATINWGDGTAPTTGTVVPGPSGTFEVDGSHTYASSGVNGGTGIFTIEAFISDVGGSKLTVPNTALVADIAITLTGILNPASDSGESNSDSITNVSQPNFYGSSAPFSTVTLYETPIAGGTAVKIGQVEAQSDGSWSVASNVLATGTYHITATAIDQFGETTTVAPVTIVPTLVVDTVAPVITNVSFDRLDGTLSATFKDNLSGMDLASLSNSAFYHISARPLSSKVHPPNLILPTSITFSSDGVPTDPVTVTVVFNHGHSMRGGDYQVKIDSGTDDHGIQDVAGNALDGDYYGKFPTGDGLPGGDFVATIATFHDRVLSGVPVKDGFVPPAARVDHPAASQAAARRAARRAAEVASQSTAAHKVPAAVHDAAVQALSVEESLQLRKAHRASTRDRLAAAAAAARAHRRLVADEISHPRRPAAKT